MTHPILCPSKEQKMKACALQFSVIPVALWMALLISTPANAQQRSGSFVQENQPVIKGGFSVSTLSSAAESGFKPGLIGGFSFFLLPNNDFGGWQIEGLIHQKGMDDLVNRGDSLRLTYIQAAGLVHFDVLQFGRGDRNALFVLGGPAVSFKAHSSYSFADPIHDITDRIRKIDFNLIAGGGLEYGSLVLEARHDWGMRSILEDLGDNTSLKNRSFAVMVGLRLGQ
jgi:hypothetical protein